MSETRWTEALHGLEAAFRAVEELCGRAREPYVGSSLLEVRQDLAYALRKVRALSLLDGADSERENA
jgi:hypothetical protein